MKTTVNMDEVSLCVGRCLDACCLLLHVVIRAFTWLLRLLSAMVTSLHAALLAVSGSTLVEYWNFALFSFLTAAEAVSGATCGAVQAVEGWLQALAGVFESFKMVGHLSCHVAWRVKDVLHRGLVSGSCVLRQTCDGLCIGLRLVLYFINTVVNVVLIGTQNCVCVLAGVWDAVADPLHGVLDLTLTLLTFLYSCVVGASVLLWTPCQLLLDFLGAVGRAAMSSPLVIVVVISLALLLLKPGPPVRLVGVLPGAGRLQMILERALARQDVHDRTPQEVNRTRHTNGSASDSETDPLSDGPPGQPDPQEPVSCGRTATSEPNCGLEDGGGRPTDGELLSLLKEQEDRKKCVICQDLSKTVLLLPCRHLCLCRHCAHILTQRRPVQRRRCPLCRQHITQTMDVFL